MTTKALIKEYELQINNILCVYKDANSYTESEALKRINDVYRYFNNMVSGLYLFNGITENTYNQALSKSSEIWGKAFDNIVK